MLVWCTREAIKEGCIFPGDELWIKEFELQMLKKQQQSLTQLN